MSKCDYIRGKNIKRLLCLVLFIKSILRLINDLVTSCVFVTGGTGRAAGFSQSSRYQVGKKKENLKDSIRLFEKNWLTYLQVGKKQRNLLPMTIF